MLLTCVPKEPHHLGRIPCLSASCLVATPVEVVGNGLKGHAVIPQRGDQLEQVGILVDERLAIGLCSRLRRALLSLTSEVLASVRIPEPIAAGPDSTLPTTGLRRDAYRR